MFDSPRERHQGRKKSPLTWWLVLTTIFVVAGLVYYVTFGPNPPIRVGKATTHITTPLDADGFPDYAAVLRAELSEGVTPENNGAILFLQAMWPPDDEIPAAEAERLCIELGMPGPPLPAVRRTPLDTPERRRLAVPTLRSQLKQPGATDALAWGNSLDLKQFLSVPIADAADDRRIRSLILNCQPVSRPWTRSDLPLVADWLDENRLQIDLVIEGVERPDWYLPSAMLVSGERNSFAESRIDLVQAQRSAARMLQTTVAFHRGEGRDEVAVRHALAIRRLAKRVGLQLTYMDQLIAIAIDGVGLAVIDRLAADPAMPVEQLRGLLEEVSAMGAASNFMLSADRGERFFCLDAVIGEGAALFEAFDSESLLSRMRIDWNPTLVRLNQNFDDIVKAAAVQPWTARRQALASLEERIQAAAPDEAVSLRGLADLALPGVRNELAADKINAMLVASLDILFQAEDRARLRLLLTRVGIALAIHRAEQGAYPDTLGELTPSLLSGPIVDTLHGKPLRYRRTEDGYLLYSVGANGVDDGGSLAEGTSWGAMTYEGREFESQLDPTTNQIIEDQAANDLYDKIPGGADDLSLRLPLPVEPWPWESP